MDGGAKRDHNLLLELPAYGPDPEGEVAFRQMQGVLKRELRRIPTLYRDIVFLRDVAELPVRKVAEKLGISVPAAKSRLVRAQKELRNRLLKLSAKNAEYTYIAICRAVQPFRTA